MLSLWDCEEGALYWIEYFEAGRYYCNFPMNFYNVTGIHKLMRSRATA